MSPYVDRTTCKHIWNAHRFCQWCGQDQKEYNTAREIALLHSKIKRLQTQNKKLKKLLEEK